MKKDSWVEIVLTNGIKLRLRESEARELGLLADEESPKNRLKMLEQIQNKMLGKVENKGAQ